MFLTEMCRLFSFWCVWLSKQLQRLAKPPPAGYIRALKQCIPPVSESTQPKGEKQANYTTKTLPLFQGGCYAIKQLEDKQRDAIRQEKQGFFK